MWRGLIALIALALLVRPAHAITSQELLDCWQGLLDSPVTMAACNRVIESKTVKTHDLAWTYEHRAKLHSHAGRFAEAVADLDLAISLRPGLTAYRDRASNLFMLNDYERGIAAYDTLIGLEPNESIHRERRAALLERKHAATTRAAAARPSAHAGSDQDFAHCTAGVETDLLAIMAACSRVIASGKADKKYLAAAYFRRAHIHSSDNRYAEAIADFDQAIALQPDRPDYYRDRGFQSHMLENFDGAIVEYEKGLALKPDDVDLLFFRALSWLKKGEDGRAFADLDKVIALKPQEPHAYTNKARTYMRRGEYEKALAVLDQGVAMKPDHAEFSSLRAEVHRVRAEVHQKSGDNDKAIADLNRVIEIEPNEQLGFLLRAILHERLGNVAPAIADYDKLLGFAPNEQFYRDRRKALLQTKGVTTAPASPPPPKVITPAATTPPAPASTPPAATTPPAPVAVAPPPARTPEPATTETRKTGSKKKSGQKAECKVYVPAANLTISVPCPK